MFKKLLKYISILIIGVSLVICCGPTKRISDNVSLSTAKMYYSLERTYTPYQVDSMITADTLAALNKWIKTEMTSQQGKLTQYMFIKSLSVDNELIYVLSKPAYDDNYKCVKRITNK